jgi:hypothetical protein
VEELKTQLGGVKEAMTKESELAEKLRREAQAAASSAQRQVRVFQYSSSSACVSKPRILEVRLRCIVEEKWGGDVHCWRMGCFCRNTPSPHFDWVPLPSPQIDLEREAKAAVGKEKELVEKALAAEQRLAEAVRKVGGRRGWWQY